MKRWALGLALAALLGVPTARAQVVGAGAPKVTAASPAAAAAKLSYRLARGQSGIYRISYTGSTEVDFGLVAWSLGQQMSPTTKPAQSYIQRAHFERRASLHWKVIDEDAAGWTLAARLQDLDFRVEGQADPRGAALDQPFTMRFDRNGTLREFTFRKGYPKALGLSIRALVEPLQAVVVDDGGGLWAAKEETAELSLETRYSRTSVDRSAGIATVTRTITSATPSDTQRANLAPLGGTTVNVSGAVEKIELDLSGRGVRRLQSQKRVSTTSPRGFVSSHEGTYVAELADGALAALPDSKAAAAVDLADTSLARASMYDVPLEQMAAVEGRDVPTIIADFSAALAKNMAAGHRLLTNYVRLYPARTLEVARAIDGFAASDPETFVGFGYAAIAYAGHVEAQQVLVRVADEPGWTALSSEKALIAMIELKYPEPFVLSTVWSMRSNPRGVGPDAMMFQSIATNVYGALGDVRKGNQAVTNEVVRTLGTFLKGTSNPIQQGFALDALSNVGDPATVIPLAAPFFSSPQPDVRRRAFGTFRLMTGDAQFQQLERRFAVETSREVRHDALLTVEQMADSAARNQWATRQLATTKDADEMRLLVNILGAGLNAHPENRAVLRAVLDKKTDRRVRRAVFAFVSPTNEGGK